MKNDMIIFENQEVKLDVNIKDDTVWLTQAQMAKLFGRDVGVISRHISNVFQEELEKKAICKKCKLQIQISLLIFIILM